MGMGAPAADNSPLAGYAGWRRRGELMERALS